MFHFPILRNDNGVPDSPIMLISYYDNVRDRDFDRSINLTQHDLGPFSYYSLSDRSLKEFMRDVDGFSIMFKIRQRFPAHCYAEATCYIWNILQ